MVNQILTSIFIISHASAVYGQSAKFIRRDLDISNGTSQITIKRVLGKNSRNNHIYYCNSTNNIIYILFTSSYWSKNPPDDHYCGGGTEHFLEWIAIKNSRLIARKKYLYISCWDNREGEIMGWQDGQFRVEVTDVVEQWRNPTSQKVQINKIIYTFNPKAPQAGIKETVYPDGLE